MKTRLVPPLTADEAARTARAFVLDLVGRLSHVDAEVVLALPADTRPDAFAALVAADVRAAEQGDGDLGARLARVTGQEFERGAAVVAAIGADHPDLPLPCVEAVLDSARRGRVGWVTTRDGGYACIALPRKLPGLFARVPWSSPEVARVTRNNADRLGVLLEDAGPWYDLDAPEDVDRFLARPEVARECPETWGVLRSLAPAWEERRRSHG